MFFSARRINLLIRIYQNLIFDMIGALNGWILGITSWRTIIIILEVDIKPSCQP